MLSPMQGGGSAEGPAEEGDLVEEGSQGLGGGGIVAQRVHQRPLAREAVLPGGAGGGAKKEQVRQTFLAGPAKRAVPKMRRSVEPQQPAGQAGVPVTETTPGPGGMGGPEGIGREAGIAPGEPFLFGPGGVADEKTIGGPAVPAPGRERLPQGAGPPGGPGPKAAAEEAD